MASLSLPTDVDPRFQLAVEAAPNAIVMVDRDRRLVLINRRAEEMFGYSRSELLGQRIDVLVPPRFRAAHEHHVEGYFEAPTSRAMGEGRDLFGQRKDGTEVPIEIGLSYLETDDWRCTVASIIDITERKRAEQLLFEKAEELDRANVELARSNRDLDEFAYVASHDLRAPLRDVDNLSQWIVEDVGDALPEASQRHLRTLQSRIRRMESLLEDLLEYSRAGRIFDESEEVDVGELLEEVVELVGPREGFTVAVAGPMPVVRAPRAPLGQILRNLIGNAIKHHDRSGGRVDVSARELGDVVEMTVSDDGPGIPPDLHDRAFAMFQTLRPRDEVEGTGMGLALVKRLVEAHGGKITVQPGEERGATFRFTWPKVWSR